MTPITGTIDILDNWAREGGAIYVQEVYLGKFGAVTFNRNTASV
jgi:hypothetical protein